MNLVEHFVEIVRHVVWIHHNFERGDISIVVPTSYHLNIVLHCVYSFAQNWKLTLFVLVLGGEHHHEFFLVLDAIFCIGNLIHIWTKMETIIFRIG